MQPKRWRKIGILFLAAVLALSTNQSVIASEGDTTRVSIASNGTQGNGHSQVPALSSDGRFVAFESDASTLVAGDTNGSSDIFVYDRQTGQTTRVSLASNGTQGNGHSYYPSLSADGRFVVFYSFASNLVNGDTNGVSDVFVHDRQTGETTLVSTSYWGQGNNNSAVYTGAISADGRYVTYASVATNLVSWDTNGNCDIFVYDRQTGTTTRASVNSDGVQVGNGDSVFPSISADGRYVAFQSTAWHLVPEIVNTRSDIFVHDMQTGVTTQESVNSQGGPGYGDSRFASISADGRYITFQTNSVLDGGGSMGFEDIYIRDRQESITTRISKMPAIDFPGANSEIPAISADGRYVAFYSKLRLASGDTNGVGDIFVYDRLTGVTSRVTVSSNGTQQNNAAYYPAISPDGRYVAFDSLGTNLVDGDTNNFADVFVHEYDITPPAVQAITLANGNPTSAASVDFTVVFSEVVTGVNVSDFVPVVTGVTGAAVANVSGSGNTYTVKVNTGTGNGTIRLDLVDDDTVRDGTGHPLGDAGMENGSFNTGEVYDIQKDITPPGVMTIKRMDPNPVVSTGSVNFEVTFSEAVTSVNTSAPFEDFELSTTGVMGAAVTNVNGSGETYTVTVDTGSGNGRIRLDVKDNNTVLDLAGNPLGGVNAGDGDYMAGETYTIIKTPTFVDVPFSHLYWSDIEILYANGLTGGCSTGPLKFCPGQVMNRGQAAAFMLRGNFGPSYMPPVPTHIFKDDWSKGPWAEGWAEGMRAEGFSAGCLTNPLKYCPWDQIPREQAVIFALRLKYGKDYTPPPATGIVFADMTNPGFYATAWAEQAYKEGIITNCGMTGGKPKFCPKDLVSRGLAAYMIVRARSLSMP